MLDEAGLENCKIVASNSLDEYLIQDLIVQGAKIDIFGVGERLITAKSAPSLEAFISWLQWRTSRGRLFPKLR